ncbi:glycosyl hydrolase family 65 protein [Methylorubrum zatmanii]|uniref:Glycosyl hydrolase family 65 protein n=1 Tax=Methylorubrum zatmanii TaxID=29429 RepID=A0ABW1WTW7_9HYPH|nr:glycosyl hydrolase family 65 protein [Methylorubrum zatmanii]MBD8905603.1 hypothetical protein [Methylorubrum zatmanii]
MDSDRYRAIKRAGAVMAMVILGKHFTKDGKRRSFECCDPLTTHDSFLPVRIQSIIANESGFEQKAIAYVECAAAMDMSDIGGTMMHGAHVAAIDGTRLVSVYGFVGLRDTEGRISFNPVLSEARSALTFVLTVRGQSFRVEIDHGSATCRLLNGERLSFSQAGEAYVLSCAEPILTRPVGQGRPRSGGAGGRSASPVR